MAYSVSQSNYKRILATLGVLIILVLLLASQAQAAPPSTAASILTTVDRVGIVGRLASLALNSSGNAVISYRDDSNDGLKVAVCNDAACTNPTLTTVDSAGDVGRFTSLALNSSGFPVISYYDDTNDDLKVAVFVPPSNTIYLPLVLRNVG